MQKDFFVIDLEFTQYTRPTGRPRAFFSEIIEIGAVRINAESHEVTGDIEQFVKPRFFPKQAAESMEFCMITADDMKDAIDFSLMIEKIKALYTPGQSYFVTWGEADFLVIDEGCARHGLPNPIRKEDCLDLAAAYKRIKQERLTTGLKKAAEELGVGADGLWHTAHADALNTGRVLLKLLEKGWTPEQYFDALAQSAR